MKPYMPAAAVGGLLLWAGAAFLTPGADAQNGNQPDARYAGTRQEWVGRPSSRTVHAPQSPESQPFFTSTCPCSRSSVRSTCPGAGSS